MSWDAYIDSLRDYCGRAVVDKGAIIGLDNGAAWAPGHADALNITAAEGATISSAMRSKDFTTFHENGVWVEGKKYRFLRGDPEEGLAFAKLKEHGSLTIQKTTQAIIITHTAEGQNQGTANAGTDQLGKYLVGVDM